MNTDLPADGSYLGEVPKSEEGWGQSAARELDALVVNLWSKYGWDHLRILIHPDTRSQTVMFMEHNFNGRIVGRKGVEMNSSARHDPDRIVVVYKSEPTEFVPM